MTGRRSIRRMVARDRRARGRRSPRPCPVARARPGPERATDRRRRSSSAGRASRSRRSPSRSAWSAGSGRSAGSTRPTRGTPSRAGGPSHSWPGCSRSRSPCSPVSSRYDTALFSIHMVQHVLLMLVAAPLLALAAPVTLILRVSSPGDAPPLAPAAVLHSRVVRFLGHPVMAWVIFAAIMWAIHFSPLFDASLEDPLDPRPRARAVPVGRAAVLVAGGRARPGAVADEPPGTDRLPVHADDPEHVPRGRHPQRHDGALSRTTRRWSGRGGSPRSRTSAWPRGSCGSPATRSS